MTAILDHANERVPPDGSAGCSAAARARRRHRHRVAQRTVSEREKDAASDIVTLFHVRPVFLNHYKVQAVGNEALRVVVPVEELPEFNAASVGAHRARRGVRGRCPVSRSLQSAPDDRPM